MHRLTLLLVLGGLVLVGCQDDRPLAPGEGPMAAISDGAHSGGNPDFLFLPPVVGDPSSDPNFDPGMFNARLHPVLAIYANPTGNECVGELTYGPVVVPVVPDEELYKLEWDTDAADLTANTRQHDEERANVACLVEQIGRSIRFQVEPSYTPEQFDVVLVRGVQR